MSASCRQFPSASPLSLPSLTAISPAFSSINSCQFNGKMSKHIRKAQKLTFPLLPPPAISAIISSNQQLVIDRKLKRKAETHKTIPCRAWKDTGRCNYGKHCKFAHGDEDLRKVTEEPVKLFNNPRYRTELCMKYHYLGSCPYGDRCSYIHEQTPKIDLEKCLEELEQSSLAESPSKLEKSESSMTCAEGLVILRTETENTNKSSISDYANDYSDPFTTGGAKENIEFTLYPFMDSFLKHPFCVR
uniref:C3H1-type domain-containing protein n=1 Tax=Syphacia muris TaxID=451379 RepID=A0A0N5AGU7_9BILA